MPIKVAIADDSAPIRRLIRAFIESHTDWDVCGEAADGQAAIAVAGRFNPDLIVLDLSMPVKNGLEAAHEISAISPNSRMVLFTAHANNQVSVRAKQAGIKATIAKHGDASLHQLVTVLQELSSTPHAA